MHNPKVLSISSIVVYYCCHCCNAVNHVFTSIICGCKICSSHVTLDCNSWFLRFETPPQARCWHGRRCPWWGSIILHIPTIMLHELHVCRFCFPSIFVWPMFGVREFMNLSTCFCPIVIYARSTTNENNIVSVTLKEFVQQHCMLKPY